MWIPNKMEMRGQDSSSLYHNHKYQESQFYAIYSKKNRWTLKLL